MPPVEEQGRVYAVLDGKEKTYNDCEAGWEERCGDCLNAWKKKICDKCIDGSNYRD